MSDYQSRFWEGVLLKKKHSGCQSLSVAGCLDTQWPPEVSVEVAAVGVCGCAKVKLRTQHRRLITNPTVVASHLRVCVCVHVCVCVCWSNSWPFFNKCDFPAYRTGIFCGMF